MAGRQSHEESLEGASAQVNMVGKFLYKISASHSTDKEGCLINSAVLLPGERLAVVDLSNECVKLFDLEARKLTGKVKLSSWPLDITAIGEDRLAVLTGNHGVVYLQLLHVKPTLARSITLPLPEREYVGVTCRGEKLYLTCLDPPSIQICDLHGTLLNQINLPNNKGRWLFRFPYSVAVSPDGAHIYVRNWKEVVCLTTEGQEVWTFDFKCYESRREIKGMDVDKQGRLFVCGSFNIPIKILSSAGRPGTLLLDKWVVLPWTVAVGDGRMYLGGIYNEILVFRLEAADSARQVQNECEGLPPHEDQSLNLIPTRTENPTGIQINKQTKLLQTSCKTEHNKLITRQ